MFAEVPDVLCKLKQRNNEGNETVFVFSVFCEESPFFLSHRLIFSSEAVGSNKMAWKCQQRNYERFGSASVFDKSQRSFASSFDIQQFRFLFTTERTSWFSNCSHFMSSSPDHLDLECSTGMLVTNRTSTFVL